MFDLNVAERNYNESDVQAALKSFSDTYFEILQSQRGFDPARVSTYKKIESAIPIEFKQWFGVYSHTDQSLIGSLRVIRVPPTDYRYLASVQTLKEKGINFSPGEMIKNDSKYSNLRFIHEAGRAYRYPGPEGEEAKKVWEIFYGGVFYGTYLSGHGEDMMLAHTDSGGAIFYEKDFGFKVKKRVYKDKSGAWKLEEETKVNRKADAIEEPENIMTARCETVKNKIFERIMTQPNYWSFLQAHPSMTSYFEQVFMSGSNFKKLVKIPKYRPYFQFNHPVE